LEDFEQPFIDRFGAMVGRAGGDLLAQVGRSVLDVESLPAHGRTLTQLARWERPGCRPTGAYPLRKEPQRGAYLLEPRMVIASLKDLYLDELADLYDAETQMIRALPRLADAAHAPELKETLTRHADESPLHLERLQLIFTHWGKKVHFHACAGLAGIVQEADERVTDATTRDARDAAIVGAAQRIEHYEIAAYGCARTYAHRLNRPAEARPLQATPDEEGRADRRLTEIAEAHINDDARVETDFAPDRPRTLRYVNAREARRAAGVEGAIAVGNCEGDTIGAFDGVLADVESGTPRYIVVDGRKLFIGGRYLLPVEHVGFDSASGFVVDLDKEL